MNYFDPKLAEAYEHIVNAQKIMTELGHTKYTLCGMVSIQMLRDSEQEVCVLLGKLNESIKQNQRLTEALENCREDSIELLGERDWWQLENRCDYQKRYQDTRDNVTRADAALESLIKS
jgi:hypothetical protein